MSWFLCLGFFFFFYSLFFFLFLGNKKEMKRKRRVGRLSPRRIEARRLVEQWYGGSRAYF